MFDTSEFSLLQYNLDIIIQQSFHKIICHISQQMDLVKLVIN